MSLLEPVKSFYASSIGKKVLVALTGIVLLVFVFVHMAGNLLVFLGPDAINEYGAWLQGTMHGFGVWFARIGLLAAFVIHVVTTIHLVRQNREARQERYAHQTWPASSTASRTMIISGIIILVFVIYHLLHFTIAPTPGPGDPGYYEAVDDGVRHDVYHMVVTGFSNWFVSAFYIFSMALLCLHLSHGFSSVFQTLGFRTVKSWPIIRSTGHAFALLIFVGNSSIPFAILFGFLEA